MKYEYLKRPCRVIIGDMVINSYTLMKFPVFSKEEWQEAARLLREKRIQKGVK